ncbi:MAG: tetratricopeptide repeat protein [Clostridia bacterium]|nr:tetratricopeptide repeat protein [Clostridia bacterium]
MNMKKIIAAGLTAGMLLTAMPVVAEEAPAEEPAVEETAVEETAAEAAAVVDTQKLDASYTLALNAINAEDYETAKEYLNVCFAYCDPVGNPTMYADLLLKQACIDVIEEKNDMALLQLDAAIRVQPDLADAYLVRTQVYAGQGNVDAAIENLEKYIELTEDTSLYETVAQLQEANGNIEAAQAAYDKYVAGAGEEVAEAGFQSGLYKMQAGQLEEAIEAFEAYAEDETYGAGAAYNIGICKMNLGDYAGAVEAFDTCESKGGAFEGIYYNRGVCRLMDAQWEAAAADFTKSVESEPYVDDARYNLAICQMQQEDYETAVTTFTALIDGEGETTEATEEAEATETEARVVNDGAYYYRAVCQAALGKLEEAKADYTVCIEHGYELAQSYYQRAQVNAALGDTEAQNADLQASLSVAE